MKLKSVRIKDFKCILDSDEFTVGPVTCLVGKNESGKTAILQSLYKLNPDVPSEDNFLDLEYPRNKWLPNMKNADLPANTLETKWELDDNDMEALSEFLGCDVMKSKSITIEKGYTNISRWSIDFDEEKLVEHVLSNAHLSAPETNQIRNLKSIKDIIITLNSLENKTQNQQKFLNDIKATYKREKASLAIIDFLGSMLPTFLYFNDYFTLPGQVALDEFNEKKAEGSLCFEDRVFQALLALAGTTPEAINDITTFERLRASLEAVSNRLSNEIFEYWTQNTHLEVTFGFDHARPEDPPPYNKGYIFRTSIKNRRHNATVSFDERSRGFVWFFSFLVWFSQVKDTYGDRLFILLDEPALNLHARAQADLLRYINERLRPSYQVIYTTHSPFMVDPDNLLGTRTVEDVVIELKDSTGRIRDQLLGTKVSDDVLSIDRDTVSPLQAAVGYDITQTLFVGKCNLIVEGPSDLLYLKWYSQQLKKKSRVFMDTRWTICPVGGVDKVASFVALFGAHQLHVAVLIDYHKGQKGKVRSLKESKLLKSSQVFTADMFTAGDEADIEDLIGNETYIALVNLAYGLKGSDLVPPMVESNDSGRILKHVESHMKTVKANVPEFDHYAPAAFLLENSEQCLINLPDVHGGMDRFERFFKEVNQLLPIE